MGKRKKTGDSEGRADDLVKRPNRREYKLDLPASIEISTSVMTVPFSIEGAAIVGVSRGGLGLMLTILTVLTREDFTKMLTRRRTCFLRCTLPDGRQLRLYGTIVWTKPKQTPNGTAVRFGLALDKTAPEEMEAFEAFLESRDREEGE